MFAIEAAFQGKSFGKIITGTRAVKKNGENLSFEQYFKRNMIRAIPFELFSALGTPCSPWHDEWSDSYVIDEKKLKLDQLSSMIFETTNNPEANHLESEA